MDKITFQNESTKLNKAMFDTFQNNIDNGKQDKIIAGTWTPTINTRENKAPTITYEKQYGKYRKIGDLVYIDFYIKGKITKLNDKKLIEYRRNDIGFVFQFYNLVQNLTAKENVELALQISKDPLDALEVLDLVGLKNRVNNFPSQLSGGEQQRVSIARAIVNGPPLLIADEPTGNLDPKNSLEVMQILDQINQRGITVIVSTHDQNMVNYFRKRVITLDNGEIIRDVQDGTYE